MRRFILFILFSVLCLSTSYALTVYFEDYEDFPVGGAAPGWNWYGGACKPPPYPPTYEDYGGNIVVEHIAVVDNTTGTTAVDSGYGSKWDIELSGNTSTDPADYTISFDIRNFQGDWDPIGLEFFVVTANAAVGSGDYGYGSGRIDFDQADGWVHVEYNLTDLTVGWWEGQDWVLDDSRWSIEVGMTWPGEPVAPGELWTQIWLFDNLKITMGIDDWGVTGPHDPNVTPLNDDGTVGTLLGDFNVRFTLGFLAGAILDPLYPVNPDILGHYIYLSNGGVTDPNVYLLAYVPQVHNADPNLTNPYVAYGPITKNAGIFYYWQVEEGLDDGTGTPYPPGHPNNIVGPLWSFITISIPPIIENPVNDVADALGNASFSARMTTATHYRWYKVASPDDVEIAEGMLDSEKRTTLNFTGAALADEGQYYCIFYNGDPDTMGISYYTSNTAWLWLPRLMGYWKFDGDTTDSVGDEVAGAPVHDGTMKTGDPNFVSETGDSAVVGSDALRIYSDGQFLVLPEADFFNFYQDGFTVNLWVKAYAPAPPGNVFLSKFDVNISGWLLRSFDGADSAGQFILEGTGTVGYGNMPDNQWNMVTVTYDPAAATVRTYTNGAMINEGTFDLAALPIPAGPVEIGGEDAFGEEVTGDIAIDELKMYSYPLTTVEIAQNYLAIAGGDWICNNELYDSRYDFDGNCKVALGDFAMFAARWLDDYRIYPD